MSEANTTEIIGESQACGDVVVDKQKVDDVPLLTDMMPPDKEGNCNAANPDTSVESEDKFPKEKDEEWMDVLGNGKLLKKVLQAGKDRSSRPVQGEVVVISTVGHLDDGTEVDKNDMLSFTLGDGDVIQAFDLCCALMGDGEKAEVITEPVYAYGEVGRSTPEESIPGNSRITYQIELLKVEGAIDFAKLAISDRLEQADKKRERGNYLYTRAEYPGSINSYTKAVRILDDSGETHTEAAGELQKLVDMRVKCYNNLAAAQLKIEMYDAAIKSCESVLSVQADNVKALFRKGKCLAARGDTQDAISSMKKALTQDPASKIIHNELSRLTNKHKTQEKKVRALYQRMMGQDTNSAKNKAAEKQVPSWVWVTGTAGAAVLLSMGIAAYRYLHV